jgi:hypothetical protein
MMPPPIMTTFDRSCAMCGAPRYDLPKMASHTLRGAVAL